MDQIESTCDNINGISIIEPTKTQETNLCDTESILLEQDKKVCFYCRKEAIKCCPHCKISFYCCDEHGSIHRPDDVCFPFLVAHLPHVGNYMVASRDIEPAGIKK